MRKNLYCILLLISFYLFLDNVFAEDNLIAKCSYEGKTFGSKEETTIELYMYEKKDYLLV